MIDNRCIEQVWTLRRKVCPRHSTTPLDRFLLIKVRKVESKLKIGYCRTIKRRLKLLALALDLRSTAFNLRDREMVALNEGSNCYLVDGTRMQQKFVISSYLYSKYISRKLVSVGRNSFSKLEIMFWRWLALTFQRVKYIPTPDHNGCYLPYATSIHKGKPEVLPDLGIPVYLLPGFLLKGFSRMIG